MIQLVVMIQSDKRDAKKEDLMWLLYVVVVGVIAMVGISEIYNMIQDEKYSKSDDDNNTVQDNGPY